METLQCWVGVGRWAAIYFLKLQRNFLWGLYKFYWGLNNLHPYFVPHKIVLNLNLVGQCFVLYALLKCFSNLPKRVNCGNIAILGGSGQMNSPFTEKNCTETHMRTKHLPLILCCSAQHHGSHSLVGQCFVLYAICVYVPNKQVEDSQK